MRFLRHGYGRHDPGLCLLQELFVLPHVVCDRNRSSLGDDREGGYDMEEKNEPVKRDIDQGDDSRLANIKEEKSPEDSHHHRDVETHLSDALHAARDTGIPNPGEVIESKAYDGGAEDDVQINQDRGVTLGASFAV
jgi:hypothetical protein